MTTASVRLRLRYDSVDAFVEDFSLFVARAGMFMPTNQPRPIGAEVKFELRLANDFPVLVGVGTVLWHRGPTATPNLPGGMGVQFARMTRESRDVVMRLLEKRAAKGYLEGADGLPQFQPSVAEDTNGSDAPNDAGDAVWGEFAAIAQHIDIEAATSRARELRGALSEADLENL